jgi:hypothetical protein
MLAAQAGRGHMHHHYPLQIPHITDSNFQLPPNIWGKAANQP